MISRNFIKSSMVYTLAGTLPMASAIILLPFYTHYLSLEVYGAYSIYLALSLLAQVIITYGFDLSIYVHYHEFKERPDRFAHFTSTAVVFVLVLGVVLMLVSMVVGPWLMGLFFEKQVFQFWPYGFISVATALFQAMFKLFSNTLQTRQQPMRFFWSNLLFFALTATAAVGGLILYPNDLLGPVGGRAFAAFVAGGWGLLAMVKEFGFRFDFQIIRDTASFNTSTYVYQLQQWVINYFDRLLITSYLTLQDVGAYDFAFKCMLAIDFVLSGLNNTFLPKVIGDVMNMDKESKQTTQAINRYYYGMVGVSMILVCGVIVCLPLFLQLKFIRPDYKLAIQYVPLIGLVYLVKSIRFYFSFPYGALKYAKPLPLMYLTLAGIKVGLMILLVPRYGILAVIAAGFASGVVELILLKQFLKGRFTFKFNAFKLLLAPLALGLLIIFVEFIVKADALVSSMVYMLVCLILLVWIYRNELKYLKPKGFF